MRADDLAKADRAIKEAETRLKTIQNNIDTLDLEIKKVTVLEGVLEDNIRVLKTKQIIAIAQEFRKAKDELKRAKVRITNLQSDKEHFNKALRDVQTLLNTAKLERSKAVHLEENNILTFRGKNGKK